MKHPQKIKILICFFIAMGSFNTWALKMPKIFSNDMVLQRDMAVPIWGEADSNEMVTAEFKGQKKSVKADINGKWMLRLDPLPASSEPETLTVMTSKEKQEFKNVLVGEVWLCSGQSNMQSSFKYLGIMKEVEGVDYPLIRLTSGSKWSLCNTKNLSRFSATGYYFGLNLWKKLQVPIGLINISRGCSSIEAWMTPESLAANDSLLDANGCKLVDEMKKFQKFHADYKQIPQEEKERVFLDYCKGKYFFARNFLKDGKLKPDIDKKILWHMTVIKPAFLYNSLIVPVIPFGIRGVIWYQGETNKYDTQYAEKQKILVESWRKLWDEGNFPFYIVQIAPKKNITFPAIWLQQFKAVNEIPNSGIITTIDIGTPFAPDGVHPTNKRDVGLRLALLALNKTYKMKNILFSGPTYKSIKIVGDKIIVSFDNCGAGLCVNDAKKPDSFEIADANGKFVKAKAVIEGNTVVVSAPSVKNPVYVSYAWHGNINPNLQNKEGLPAFPFNTAEPFFQKK
jgi:sialate O-acetylesterase